MASGGRFPRGSTAPGLRAHRNRGAHRRAERADEAQVGGEDEALPEGDAAVSPEVSDTCGVEREPLDAARIGDLPWAGGAHRPREGAAGTGATLWSFGVLPPGTGATLFDEE